MRSSSTSSEHNSLVTGEDLSVLNTPIELQQIKVPVFVTGALTDHLTPWKGCYRTTQMLGGEATFVLSYSGHIASLVNPPGNPKAHYWTGGPPAQTRTSGNAGAERQPGSWWEAWAPGSSPTPATGSRRPIKWARPSTRHSTPPRDATYAHER